MQTLRWLSVLIVVGCAAGPRPATSTTRATSPESPPTAACDIHQVEISHEADTRAAPYSIAQHLAKNFPDGQVSWLMKDASYQNYIVTPAAKSWGRCVETGCYVFVAPAAVIHDAVAQSMSGGHHDPAALGRALGLPATNFEGPLRMMTLDTTKVGVCTRLPVDSDPGIWKCQTASDTDCFKFGGYTSGGVPELMVINAPVDRTMIEEVP